MQIAVCNLYPNDYWGLNGVSNIEAPPELWWSSRERKAFELGLPTSEYLELDFGRLRSMNFLNFNVIQKPINILVEYDVWGFDSGVKLWQPVTRVPNERFDDSIQFTPNSANPWKNCQFYFTNTKGDLLSTRYMRIKFDRRGEPWPNGDAANTFPWSIDVKSLRTARYVIGLNDTRGVLVQQGKVTHPIVDPIHYDDIFTDVPKVIGIPSSAEVFHEPVAHDGETYIGILVSNDSCGIYSSSAGTGGMAATVNGNGQLAGTDNNSGSHHVNSTSITLSEYTDTNETGHALADLPGFGVGWAFFFPHPFNTESFCWMIAMGTAASAGAETTALIEYSRNYGAGTIVASNNNFSPPAAGTVMTYGVIVGNSETISDESLLTGAGWTRQFTDVSGIAHGFTLYYYTKVATGSEGGSYNYPNLTLSASAKWATTFSYLGTPSDPTGTCYVIDSGTPADVGSVGGSPGLSFTSSVHGA